MEEQFFESYGKENLGSSFGGYIDPPQSSPIEVILKKQVDEAVKREMKVLNTSLVEAVTREVQHGVQAAVPQIIEGVLRGMQARFPVDDVSTRMTSTMNPCPQSLTQPSSSSDFLYYRSLHIEGQLPKCLYTCKKLNDHEEFYLEAVLRDEYGNTVNIGTESSGKIAIVVLRGDFKAEEYNDLTGGLDKHVLKEREGKPKLLVGELEVTLNNGVARIGDFKFMDNSSWTRSRKFKLGAKFVGSVSHGVFIREAISEAFEVKERRGETGQKKNNPSLDDKVWKLHGIRKNGPYQKALEEKGINDVRALLNHYDKNPNSIKEILQVPDTIVKRIINHAALARSSVGVLDVQSTSAAVEINATHFTNGSQAGFVNVSETLISTGTIFPDIHSISNLHCFDATAGLSNSDINIEEFFAMSDEPQGAAVYDSNESRTKFSPKWCVIRAAQRVISLRIMIASKPQKKQKI